MDHLLIRLHTLQMAANNLRDKIKSLEKKLFFQSKVRPAFEGDYFHHFITEKLDQTANTTRELFLHYSQLNTAETLITHLMKAAGN